MGYLKEREACAVLVRVFHTIERFDGKKTKANREHMRLVKG